MKKGRYTEDQMVRILREADQAPVTEVARRHGVSEATPGEHAAQAHGT